MIDVKEMATQMRELLLMQQRYFRGEKELLVSCRSAEHRLLKLCNEILNENPKTPSLFDAADRFSSVDKGGGI